LVREGETHRRRGLTASKEFSKEGDCNGKESIESAVERPTNYLKKKEQAGKKMNLEKRLKEEGPTSARKEEIASSGASAPRKKGSVLGGKNA